MDVISSTSFVGGKYVKQFARNFESIYGVKHCIPVANGTDSLYIIMKMLGIGGGDEVITPSNSWISSSETISQTGAKPVFIDINPEYFTMDETLLEGLINDNTKAIMPVHLYGQACNIEEILKIAKKHQLYVIEDCAQAHFSKFNEINVGLFGIAGSFSFYPGKNLGAYGDAGCIITNDTELAEKSMMYANHGALTKHEHKFEGINSRMDGLQASILNVKLNEILKWTEERVKNAQTYSRKLSGIQEIKTPKIRGNTSHSFHLYVIRCGKRDQLKKYLFKKGISTAVHYPTILPNLTAYSYLNHRYDEFEHALKAESEILSLPIYPELSEKQINYICQSIEKFYS